MKSAPAVASGARHVAVVASLAVHASPLHCTSSVYVAEGHAKGPASHVALGDQSQTTAPESLRQR